MTRTCKVSVGFQVQSAWDRQTQETDRKAHGVAPSSGSAGASSAAFLKDDLMQWAGDETDASGRWAGGILGSVVGWMSRQGAGPDHRATCLGNWSCSLVTPLVPPFTSSLRGRGCGQS